MENMIGTCGIVCTACPAFIATKNDDNNAREELAKKWSKEFKSDIKSEHINCDGCLSTSGKLFTHCAVCEIRKCGHEKKVENCAVCEQYGCEKISNFHKMVPDAKKVLDNIKNQI